MYKNLKIIFAISCLSLSNFQLLYASTRKFCKINLKNDLNGEHLPILVTFNKIGSVPKYIYPTLKNPENIIISAGQNLKVFCPGKANRKSTEITEPGALRIYDMKLKPSRPIETIECIKNDEFKVSNYADVSKNNVVHLKNITCEQTSESAILRKVNEKCGTAERYEIGYDLGNGDFLKTIDICHDENEAKTLWAHAVLVPVNQEKYRSKGSGSTSFKTGQLYGGMHMSSKGPYDLENQFKTILSLVNDDKKARKYSSVLLKDRKFLAKGHLIARADKFYRSEQDSTYFFVNVVPMWQQINAQPGNWFFVEEYIRHLAFQKDSEFNVWAGGIGTLELENESDEKKGNEDHDKLLILDDKIPVPQVLFKCAVDDTHKEGLCFLVVNNPYLTKTQVEKSGDQYIVCKKYNLCEKANPDYNKSKLGYFYCCKLSDFIHKFQKGLGLEDLEGFKNYKEMTLFTNEKIPKKIQ